PGQTRIAMLLKVMIEEGMNFDEIVEKATAFISTMKTLFVLEDLSNLVKNGRISKAAGIVGSMLSLRPIMGEDGHGNIVCLEKARGTHKALARLVEIIGEYTKDKAHHSLVMVLSYCNCVDRAMALKKDILDNCAAFKEVVVVPTSGISTVYANNGGIVIAF
ncbi:MAG: DegV family protein, partial [Oscillospiraceae bacterium]|nr:DegV family protein [Oscillospiraceae bacterium]